MAAMQRYKFVFMIFITIFMCIIHYFGWTIYTHDMWSALSEEVEFSFDRQKQINNGQTKNRTTGNEVKPTTNFKTWSPPILPAHLQGADQDNPELIQHILEKWIIPPFTGKLNISEEQITNTRPYHDYSQHGQPTLIDEYLHHTKNGFIVECGAADGYITSNSLYFELNRNWNGILIEANPIYFSSLLEKRRHMFMLNACLSPTNKSILINFATQGVGGGIINLLNPLSHVAHTAKTGDLIQCFPLYSVLAAIGVYHVDYFSLDVEGAELDILKTIPFDKVKIDIFSLEKRVKDDKNGTLKKEKDIIDLLRPHGFNKHTSHGLDIVLFSI